MAVFPLAPEHEAALEVFLRDFEAAGEARIPAFFPAADMPHREKVEKLAAWARGDDIGEGWVPCTTLFGFDGSDILGVVNIRHRLNEALLRHGGHIGYSVAPSHRRRGHGHRLLQAGVEVCRSFGIERVLVSCEPTNTGSVRIIERAGGVLAETYFNTQHEQDTSLYWIDAKSQRSA